jgi:hypothetical protein
MSQRFEDRVIPQRTECVLVEMACDMCGTKAERPGAGEWFAKSSFDVSTVRIECREGSAFPEGSNTTTHSFDICPKCFHERLTTFMAAFGAKPKIQDY